MDNSSEKDCFNTRYKVLKRIEKYEGNLRPNKRALDKEKQFKSTQSKSKTQTLTFVEHKTSEVLNRTVDDELLATTFQQDTMNLGKKGQANQNDVHIR